MSRKATITQEEIVNAAFKITVKEGFDQITSRKLAGAAGCSENEQLLHGEIQRPHRTHQREAHQTQLAMDQGGVL